MKNGSMQRWQCMNRDCAAPETCGLPRGAVPPQCGCGWQMERTNVSVIFSYLDFLRDEEHQVEEQLAKKE
jgi:hypothetical protein